MSGIKELTPSDFRNIKRKDFDKIRLIYINQNDYFIFSELFVRFKIPFNSCDNMQNKENRKDHGTSIVKLNDCST